MPLLVSGDGSLDRLEVSNGHKDEHGVVRIPARIKIPEVNWGDFLQGGLDAHKSKLQFSTASGKARLGFDVESIRPEEMESRDNGDGKVRMLPATLRFWPGQDRLGAPVENPIPSLLTRWMKETRINIGRLFAVTEEEGGAFSEEDIAAASEWIQYHRAAKVLSDGRIVLPFSHVNYPVRFDSNTLRKDALREAVVVGRGAIEAIQPAIPSGIGDIPAHAYRIGATQFSLSTGLRAVIDPVVIDRQTSQPTAVRHGTSVVWDGGRTTGLEPQHLRHLEVENGGEDSVLSNEIGVAVRVYHAHSSERLPKTVYSIPSEKLHEKGIQVDHFLGQPAHAKDFRAAFARLDKESESLHGIVVGPKGIRPIYAEPTQEYQDIAVIAGSEAAMRQEFDASQRWPELAELQAFLGHVSDYRERAMLLTRSAPSADALSTIMKLGLRGVCTPNVAGSADGIYLNEAQLQTYSTLMKRGFGLYLLTEQKIRKLWHQLFVDVNSLEKVASADFRVGGYASSAAGAEKVMQQGNLEEALVRIKRDYPHAAMVTGASQSGGMGYLNSAAEHAGLTTIGIATRIPGQENASDSYDGVMYHDRADFVTRQAHLSRMISMPWVSVGAEGSGFEEALQRADLKIALGAFCPISYIDPVGLGADGEHMWKQPIVDMQRAFTTAHEQGDAMFTLSRSPYVASLLHFVTSYADAYEKAKPFFEDPVKFLRGRGVPDNSITLAIESMLDDAKFTGLPMHAFWQNELQKRRK